MAESQAALHRHPLVDDILAEIGGLIVQAEEASRPLEVDPYRARLFELFVTANGASLTDSGQPLAAEQLCKSLADIWGITDAARQALQSASRLEKESLGKMRSLWSLLRMWMEWDYAWGRWEEFHPAQDVAIQQAGGESVVSE